MKPNGAPKALILAALMLPNVAHAGAWTRDQGHFYLNTGYARIAASGVFAPDFTVTPTMPYAQHLWTVYGEVGLLTRWLTATVDAILFRHNSIKAQGATYGMSDWRVGLWTGLVTRPVRLSLGVTLGIPIGDKAPSAGNPADSDATSIARTLPTGDGEWDIEGRVALGYSFGGVRRWPVLHYLVAEAGYWVRTEFSDSFVWRFEFGTQFPYRFIDRFWFIWKFSGIESFASNEEAAMDATGLGEGVTYVSPGFTVYGRIYRGLGASIGLDSALRGRSVAAGAQLMVKLSYEW